MELVAPPGVVELPERPTLGIRVVTPFRGMLGAADELSRELRAWVAKRDVETVAFGFGRLYVVDMSGPMDIEVGFVTRNPCEGDERVRAGAFPAGRYATPTYVNHGIPANLALIEWAHDNGHALGRHEVAEGDAFACRHEQVLTDPKTEPRKTRQRTELAIKLA